jgi:hypothetical protein
VRSRGQCGSGGGSVSVKQGRAQKWGVGARYETVRAGLNEQ